MQRTLRLLGLAAIVALPGCHRFSRTVTTGALLDEMTDLRALAEFPDPAFTCRQFSSYDRASRSPAEGWFANADASHYLRVEENAGRREWVMMDAEGPGAIVRIWSANPQGTLRIYLDGNAAPVIETPMTAYLGGDFEGIPQPIAGTRSRGWNSYFPIPYAEHCKVTCDADGFYYHVNYRTYEPGTTVRSFTPRDLDRWARRTGSVANTLKHPRTAQVKSWWGKKTHWHAAFCAFQRSNLDNAFTLPIDPGETVTVATCRGARAISKLGFQTLPKQDAQSLRHLVLEIDFDGQPAVRCPLGDFFGSAPGLNPYASLPCGMTASGRMWSHWLMPFAESAEVRIRNRGDQAVNLAAEVVTIPHRWTNDALHFHARWRQSRDVPTRPMIDWNYLTAQGRGVYVGAAFSIANPVRNWWGEGDEKIYVDGETFPSHFGTGTEDYYGYAWCHTDLFTHAYHNQTRCDGPGNYGHTSVNRWHVLDRIPFTHDFRFDMELWHWTPDCAVDMSVVACWYARPGSTDTFEPLAKQDLALEILPKYVIPRVPGAIEGENMRNLTDTVGVAPQHVGTCSGEQHLWWHQGVEPGDKLILGFQVAESGLFRVLGRFVKAGDYGIARLDINGQSTGEPIDFYHEGIAVSDEIELGTFDLPAGDNQLTVEIVGANDNAKQSYMFGLDYLRLE